jgi:hypothetical protein
MNHVDIIQEFLKTRFRPHKLFNLEMQVKEMKKREYYTETNMVVNLQESLRKANEPRFLEIETRDGNKFQVLSVLWSTHADQGFLPGDVSVGNTMLRTYKTDYSFRVMDHVIRLVVGLPYDPIFTGLHVDEIILANDEVMEALEEFRLNRLKSKVIEKLTLAIQKDMWTSTYLKWPKTLAHLMIFAAKWDPNGELEKYGAERMKILSHEDTNALILHLVTLFKEKL